MEDCVEKLEQKISERGWDPLRPVDRYALRVLHEHSNMLHEETKAQRQTLDEMLVIVKKMEATLYDPDPEKGIIARQIKARSLISWTVRLTTAIAASVLFLFGIWRGALDVIERLSHISLP